MQCKTKPFCSLTATFTGYLWTGVAVKVGTSKLFTSSALQSICYPLAKPHIIICYCTFVSRARDTLLRSSVTHTDTPSTHTHTLSHIKSIIKTFLTSHFHSWQLFSAHVFVLLFLFSPPTLTQLSVVLLTDGKRYSNFSRRSPLRSWPLSPSLPQFKLNLCAAFPKPSG